MEFQDFFYTIGIRNSKGGVAMNDVIGANIARLRKEKNMTQDQLANLMGISFQAVSKWENGVSLR